jgi:Delta24-sterol reductase
MRKHREIVDKVAHSVKQFYKLKTPFRIFHGSTNSTRNPHTTPSVDTSSLSRVLDIDPVKKIALVEPNVPMDRLVATTLRYKLVPPVVMEFPGITVGGGYAGTSGESSSFRHGFFDKTINSVEMVLGNGDVVIASPDNEHADLFHGAAGAVGSCGIATLVELQLIDAKPFVETTYHPVASMAEAREQIAKATQDSALEYVDGIMFSKTSGAIITGRLVEHAAPGVPVQYFSRPTDPWFYMHVQEQIENNSGDTAFAAVTEIVPLEEYLFRYDRGGFWVGDSAFKYTMFPNTKWLRCFLDDFLHTRMLYRSLHASGIARQYMVQDIALPDDTVEEFVNYTATELDIWPLWLCPLKQTPAPTLHPHDCRTSPAMEADGVTLRPMLNVGLWGEPSRLNPYDYDAYVQVEHELEAKLLELGGMKWGYGKHFYPQEQFWQMFDTSWYNALRAKYHATSLPTLYDKITVDVEVEKERRANNWKTRALSIWPIGGIYALWKAIESKDYLMHRKSENDREKYM